MMVSSTGYGWCQSTGEESALYIADDVGHSVIWSDTCAEAALGKFLDHPEREWAPECAIEEE